jgi:hypothetical protein
MVRLLPILRLRRAVDHDGRAVTRSPLELPEWGLSIDGLVPFIRASTSMLRSRTSMVQLLAERRPFVRIRT